MSTLETSEDAVKVKRTRTSALDRILQVLDFLQSNDAPATAYEIARAVGVSSSSARISKLPMRNNSRKGSDMAQQDGSDRLSANSSGTSSKADWPRIFWLSARLSPITSRYLSASLAIGIWRC